MTTNFKTIEEINNGAPCPIPLEIILNKMGINLCSVEGVVWTQQDDGQLVSCEIKFIPNK